MPIGDAALAGAREEVKAWLRLETEEEDAIVDRLVRSAIGCCEGFVGQALILREEVQRLPVSREWQRLRWTPVSAIMGVTGLPAEGAVFALPIGAYGVDIDGNGDGWVRVTASGAAGRVDVTFMAGVGGGCGKASVGRGWSWGRGCRSCLFRGNGRGCGGRR